MPFRRYKCPECDTEIETKQRHPHCPHHDYVVEMKLMLTTPNVKLQETDPYTGKSRLQNQDKILKERARNHARDNELDDLIAMNDSKSAKDNQWIVEGGRKRKAVDDL